MNDLLLGIIFLVLIPSSPIEQTVYIQSSPIEQTVYLQSGQSDQFQILLDSGDKLHWRFNTSNSEFEVTFILWSPSSQPNFLSEGSFEDNGIYNCWSNGHYNFAVYNDDDHGGYITYSYEINPEPEPEPEFEPLSSIPSYSPIFIIIIILGIVGLLLIIIKKTK